MTEGLIDTGLEGVRRLGERLGDELSVEAMGFIGLADIADERLRAIASDLLLASVGGIETNLREASEHAGLLTRLIGPNGRTMPDIRRPDEMEEMWDIDRELTGFFRAIGSTLDCLGATAIVMLRLPTAIHRASVESLVGLRARADAGEGERAAAWGRAAEAFETGLLRGPEGWFEWTLEMRNAVIHRARQLRIWLPRPSPPVAPGNRILIATETPPHRLIRYELHLRRSPWLADMDALSGTGSAADNWLPEPSGQTTKGILEQVLAVVDPMVGSLSETWAQTATGDLVLPSPTSEWAPGAPTERARRAARLEGFDPAYEVPPLDAIVMNPRDAKRAAIAEGLRQAGLDLAEVEA
jgi:hypothetical protein